VECLRYDSHPHTDDAAAQGLCNPAPLRVSTGREGDPAHLGLLAPGLLGGSGVERCTKSDSATNERTSLLDRMMPASRALRINAGLGSLLACCV